MNHTNYLRDIKNRLLDQDQNATKEDLITLANFKTEQLADLMQLAHQIRLKYCGEEVEIEGILSAKTGGCPEDCHFCSQSAKFDSPIKATPMLSKEEVLKAAKETQSTGATEFCIVLAIRGPDARIMKRLEELTQVVIQETGLNVAISAGILEREQASTMKSFGVHRYNHNLETARSYFPLVVTTHSYEERYQTCIYVKESGMELCSGLIYGLGETKEQRVELLLDLMSLEPEEVPVNFLNPRPGTPFATLSVLSPYEALKWISISRIALKRSILRYAGGREITLGHLQKAGLEAGINALIVGNYLTTLGQDPSEDLKMLSELRMPISTLSKVL